ncbi:MAG: hypothetical protein EOP83_15885 [Verrucomicrobiaceae bacterium]|nr:MAG: hypothetical protein EOP83_15885 [Verrucomicrobiaceae bacterium]
MIVHLPSYGDTKHVRYVQIDPHDTWGMDSTLATLIVPMLKQLRQTKHGVPSQFVEIDPDSQGVFDFIDKDVEFEVGVKKWESLIDQMIWSFSKVQESNWGYDNIPAAQYKAHQERIQTGLDLFANHFGSLWD